MINAPDSVIELEVDYLYYSDGLRKGKTVTTSYELSDSVTEREYSYVYNGSQLTGLTVVVTVDGATEENHVMRIGYDTSGPMFIKYNDLTYQYVTNLQGDVIALLDHTGAVVVEYTYDAWGNILSITGSKAATLGEYNPLRYRGYVYDTETGLYYLQSRYYDPNRGRFINADALVSTGQGLLGNNMFAYCQNNPVIYIDPYGDRIVGIGVQGEITIGGISVGIEIVIYFDPEVCGDSKFMIVAYTYSGYELSARQLSTIMGLIDIAAIAGCMESSYNLSEEYNTYLENSVLGQVLRGIFLQGGSATLGLFGIDGGVEFNDPTDYSGKFESLSLSMSTNGRTGSVFYSYADKCVAVGMKYGVSLPPGKGLLKRMLSFDGSYSVSYYSDPIVLYRG